MEEQTMSCMVTLKDYVCHRDFTLELFVRGTLQKIKFKLATERTTANKFDDVIVYVEPFNETKHAEWDGSNSKTLSEERENYFDQSKYMKSDDQVEREDLKDSDGNLECSKINNAIVNIFKSGVVEKILVDTNTPVADILTKSLPLIIRLLAEISKDDLECSLQSQNENDRLEDISTGVLSMVSLMEHLVRRSFSKVFNLDPYNNCQCDTLYHQYIVDHEIAAIKGLSYRRELRDVRIDQEKNYDTFRKRIEDGKEKSLLISVTENEIEFVHKSVAEYFVARYLYENLQRTMDCLCPIIDRLTLVSIFFFLIVEEKLDQSSAQLSILSTVCGSNNLIAFWACEALCLGVLKSLSNNHDLSMFCSFQYGTLLHVAAKIGSYEICSFLLEKTRINVNDLGGRLGSGDDPSAHLLPFMNHQTSLHLAVEFDHAAVAKLLLTHSADVNAPDSNSITPLHMAVQKGHKDMMILLLNHSANVNALDSDSFTPLHVAVKQGHSDMIRLLMNHSADLNVQTNNGDTPLHVAIDFKHADCVKLLIDLGANVNISNKYGLTPLVLAVREGFPSIVAQLISKSANVNIQCDTSDERKTLLHLAAGSGNLDIVNQIVPFTVNVDTPDSSGATPLYYAATGGHVEIVKHLIELKANVNAQGPNTQSPLHWAVMLERTDVVKVLIAHAADVHALDSNGSSLLHKAAQGTSLDIVKLLIDKSIDVNAVDEYNMTALYWAAKNNNSWIVKLLLDHSADPNIPDCDGWTPLHCAANQGSLEAIELLVEQSININARTSEDQTPLHLAASSGYRDIVGILIRKSADLNAINNKRWTPLHVAIKFGRYNVLDLLITRDNVHIPDQLNCTPLLLVAHTDGPANSVKLLIDNNSNVNACRNDGWTVLHWAAERGHIKIAELLVERSAHVNTQDASQRTPLHLAAINGHTTIVQLLIGHSAIVTAHNKDKNTPLHLAIENGHSNCVKLLINATERTPLHLTNVNALNKRKWTPLHLAAHYGCREITQLLIDTSSTEVDAQDKEGQTPLHMAAKNGHVDVAEVLINESANVNAQDKKQWTPLHLAARSGHKKLVELLLSRSADGSARDGNGETPLDLATSSRRTEVVHLLMTVSSNQYRPQVKSRSRMSSCFDVDIGGNEYDSEQTFCSSPKQGRY